MKSMGKFKDIALLSLSLSLTTLISMNVVLPSHIADLGGDIALIGLVYSLRSVVRSIARLLSGLGSNFFGKKYLILVGLLVRALAFFTIFSATNILMVAIGMTIIACSEGLIEPVFLSSAADIFADTSMAATAFGIAFTIRRSPTVIAPTLTGYIADQMGAQNVFLIATLFAVIGFIISLKIEIKNVNANTGKISFRQVGGIVNKPFLMLLVASIFLFTAVSSMSPILSYWVVDELNYSYTILGMILTTGAFIGIFSRVYIGYLSDRIGHVNTLMLVGLVRLVSTLLLIFARDPVSIAFTRFLWSAVMAAPPRNALIASLCKRDSYALAYSIVGIAIDIGRILGPGIVGYIISLYGFNWGFITISMSLTAFILTLLILRRSLIGYVKD